MYRGLATWPSLPWHMMIAWHGNVFSITGSFVRGMWWWPVDSPHKGPVMQKVFPCHIVTINASDRLIGVFDDFFVVSLNKFATHIWFSGDLRCIHTNHTSLYWTDHNAKQSELAQYWLQRSIFMMMSSNENIFRVTGLLCGEFTGPQWIPHTKASDAELWCFLWSASE